MGRIMIAGISSGCGKTTLVCGLLAVLKSRGLKVCSFKCGPDYIDPYFHRSVLGIPSYNLDPWFYDTDKLRHICNNMACDCDISVIEGAMGYYDGIGFSPKCSSYQVAAATQTPTVLVVDASGMGYSSIAMLEGFLHFKVTKQIDGGLNMDGGRGDNLIQGVIFNRMSKSLYQEAACIVRSLGIVPLGYLPRNNDISLNSRHLGLVMPDEDKYSLSSTEKKIQRIAELIGDTIDVDGLIELASLAEPLTNPPCHRFNNELTDKDIPLPPQYEKNILATCDECVHPLIDALSGKGPACKAQEQKLRIAVARDSAFCFFYPLDAMLLEQLGCELVYFSPVQGETLPKGICGLILPGGYPELYAKAISSNTMFLKQVKEAILEGLPTIAECGGFMVLHDAIEAPDGAFYPMAGLINGCCNKGNRLMHFGYVSLTAADDGLVAEKGSMLRAHEFHYWNSTVPGSSFKVEKASNTASWETGYSTDSLYAGFPHIPLSANLDAADRFVSKAISYKNHLDQKQGGGL